MGARKTLIVHADRVDLIALLRSLADNAPARANLTDLAVRAVDEIEREVAADPDLTDWYARVRRGALADRAYAELALLLKAKRLDVQLPFMAHPIPLSPRQGVRLKGMQEYQQTLFLAFTWDEYEAWRDDWLGRYARAGDIRAIITLIDRVRLTNPKVASIGAALRMGGASITAIMEDAA